MINQLVFATNNSNKVAEVKKLLHNRFDIISLKDAGIQQDIPEPFDTLEENAAIKSTTIFKLTGQHCFSEDTGLFVAALQGQPGVKSARYAGEQASNEDNIEKLLQQLQAYTNRQAYFKTVISLILDGKQYLFDGICHGTILPAKKGTSGFGYDAVFMPDGSNKSFGEMTMDEKAQFSHRKKAVKKLVEFLDHL
jgi:XTP/dITP diphosphohydrolase